MKKLLITVLISALMATNIYAQEEEFDFSEYIDMLTSGDLGDIEIGSVIGAETLAELDEVDSETGLTGIEQIQEVLEEAQLENPDLITDDIISDTVILVTEMEEIAQTAVDSGDTSTFELTLDDAATSASTDPDVDITIESITDGMTEAIAELAMDEIFTEENEEDLKDTLLQVSDVMTSLAAFGKANAMNSMTSSMFGHQGYKLFTVSASVTGSFAADQETVSSFIEDPEVFIDEIESAVDNDNFSVGFATEISVSAGINLGFLIDGLYLGAVYGGTSITMNGDGLVTELMGISVYEDETLNPSELSGMDLGDSAEVTLNSLTAGLKVNYQLVKPVGIPVLFGWNGISLGTGVIYNEYGLNANMDIGELLPVILDDGNDYSSVDMNFKVGINSSSVTIPLEASTGVELLSLVTLSVGGGVDLVFGSTSVSTDLTSGDPDDLMTSVLTTILDNAFEESGAEFAFGDDYEDPVSILNPRVMANVGAGIGPLTVNVPFVYYINSGFTTGINFVLSI